MIGDSWHSYPSIFNLGHKAVRDILSGEFIQIEEKIDGSQFSFGRYGPELRCRSKNAQINVGAPDKMFTKAVDYVQSIFQFLPDGMCFSGEYLMKPKHNTLCYSRVPQNHIIIFDVRDGDESYWSEMERTVIARQLGFETIPVLHRGPIADIESVQALLQRESILGGPNVEGIVVKDYTRFGQDKKVLMAKYVSEAFKEVHGTEWRKANPTSGDIIHDLIESYRVEARWNKAVQRLRDLGVLTETPADIGPLMKAVVEDVYKEEEDAIRDVLFKKAWKHIGRGITGGLPEWYKLRLAAQAFDKLEGIHESHGGTSLDLDESCRSCGYTQLEVDNQNE
jgi:hypothetical protein